MADRVSAFSADQPLTRGENTQQKLIRAGIRLFSKYGYDSTSTRMIAQEANVNLSSISFHFSGKESLYIACLEFIAKKADEMYAKAFQHAEDLLTHETVTREEAYDAISEILELQLKVTFGKEYQSSLQLVYWEQINAMNGYHPVTNIVCDKIEGVIAHLFTAGAGIPHERALIASRFINGSIISFGEHRLLVRYTLGEKQPTGDLLPDWVCHQIRDFAYMFIDSVFASQETPDDA